MLSDTLTKGLEKYDVGSKIRALRIEKGMALVQLGEHSGLSTPMLSKIERGQLFPTLPTLLRIAMVFGVGLEYFFIADKERPLIAITRKAERLRFPEQQGTQDETYTFESLNFPVTDRKLDGYLAEFSIDSKPSESHSHEGIELVFVMKGALAITINGEDQLLGEGDAIYFDSGSPHSYRRTGKSTCSAIIVTT